MKLLLFSAILYFTNFTLAAEQCKILKVGGSTAWQPIGYVSKKSKKLVGISYDLINHIGNKLNIPINIKALPWKRLLKTVKTGDWDIITAAYKTDERKILYHYSIPYFSNEVRVFVPKGGEFVFKQLEHLAGRIGIKPSGGSYGQTFDDFAKKTNHFLPVLLIVKVILCSISYVQYHKVWLITLFLTIKTAS
jgi:ABC-type amino acid transport substrate-binding protein